VYMKYNSNCKKGKASWSTSMRFEALCTRPRATHTHCLPCHWARFRGVYFNSDHQGWYFRKRTSWTAARRYIRVLSVLAVSFGVHFLLAN
jgi:hypothetical protein